MQCVRFIIIYLSIYLSIYHLYVTLLSNFCVAAVESDSKFMPSFFPSVVMYLANFPNKNTFSGGEKEAAPCFHQAICCCLQGLGACKFRHIIRVCFCWEFFICRWCGHRLLSWTSGWSHSGICWRGHTVKLISHWV